MFHESFKFLLCEFVRPFLSTIQKFLAMMFSVLRISPISQLLMETEDQVYSPVLEPEEKPGTGPGHEWTKAMYLLRFKL